MYYVLEVIMSLAVLIYISLVIFAWRAWCVTGKKRNDGNYLPEHRRCPCCGRHTSENFSKDAIDGKGENW